MDRFIWRPDYASGHEAMDETHREFVVLVDDLLECPVARLEEAFRRFTAHARAHFDAEDRWMAATAYGAAGCHVDEHKAVLKSVDEVAGLLARGRTEPVRAIARALADWFPEHAIAMDAGLARWLTERRLGGAPVRIHRMGRGPDVPNC